MIYDYTGMTIGELTVLREVPNPGRKGKAYLCRCSCGNHIVKTVKQLSNAYYYKRGAHCGCLTQQHRRAFGSILISTARYTREVKTDGKKANAYGAAEYPA